MIIETSVQKTKHPSFSFPAGTNGLLQYTEIIGNYNPDLQVPHTHDYFHMTFLLEGSMKHMVDFQDVNVIAPAVMLMTNEQLHQHTPFHDCHIIVIYFLPDLLLNEKDDLYEKAINVFSNPIISFNPSNIKKILPYLSLLKYQSDNEQDTKINRLLLQIILQVCGDAVEKSGQLYNYRKNKIYQDFNMALQKHIKLYHQVIYYADLMNVTSENLNMVIKQQTGKTPKQIIDQRLVTHAKGMLYWYDQTVREVAWALGFETDAYFNRFFKKHTGMTPKEYQRKNNFGKYSQTKSE